MRIFDSHAHYFDARFEGKGEALLRTLMPEPVCGVVNVATNCENARLALEQASRIDRMFVAIGIHPEDCHYIDQPDAALAELRTLLGDAESRRGDKIVALGEIGLDYHWQQYGDIPMDKQKQAYFFEAQMQMARACGLPVIIHDREAHGDCFETVLKYPDVRGVFHSYSGSADMARELTRRGWYISFSGTLSFKNANRVREAAAAVPRDKLLVETDAPYLAPHPHRGERNHSGLIVHTLAPLAQLWGCSLEQAAEVTGENAESFFFGV